MRGESGLSVTTRNMVFPCYSRAAYKVPDELGSETKFSAMPQLNTERAGDFVDTL